MSFSSWARSMPTPSRDLEDLVAVELAGEFHQRIVQRQVLALLDRGQRGEGRDLEASPRIGRSL